MDTNQLHRKAAEALAVMLKRCFEHAALALEMEAFERAEELRKLAR